MKIKATLRRPGGAIDVAITTDATATIGDVAQAIITSDPSRSFPAAASATLRVADPFAAHDGVRVVAADTTMADAALLSGSTIEVVAASAPSSTAGATPVARIRMLEGPDAGKEFAVASGSVVIGRDRECDVRLSDPLVSKRHARFNIRDAIEIVDLNSANGVIVGSDLVGRAALAPNDIVRLGDSVLCAFLIQQSATDNVTPQIDHVRSPRVIDDYQPLEFPAPTPPKRPDPHRLPLIALLAPLVIGAVTFALTRQVLGVVMMAMSPLLLIAGFVDQSMTSRRRLKAQKKDFAASMIRAQESLEEARDQERRARVKEIPGTAEVCADARRLGPLLWTERPESPTFLTLHAGLGTLPSRNRVVLPSQNDTLVEFWDQLTALQGEYSRVSGVPVPLALRESGSVGFAGPAARVAAVARSAVMQLACRHSPSELVISAIVSPAALGEWEWLKWMPHASSAHSPLGDVHLADSRTSTTVVLAALEALIERRRGTGTPAELRGPVDKERAEIPDPVVPAVLVVIDNAAAVERSRLNQIVERGPDAGVHVLWVASRVEQLPAACRSIVSIDASGRDGIAGVVRRGTHVAPVELESMDAADAGALARILAPVVDIGAPTSDDSDLPRSVAYPTLAGTELLESAGAVVERWRQNDSLVARDGSAPRPRRAEGNLRALVGHAGHELFTLDLRTDGPHALVGGTTGAGKSEFLQAWVLGMAAAHSPDRLTFLFVDYKGGSAFADCVRLPHTVGLVTDLSPHLVRRALTSLRAELRYREHLLNSKRAKDLITLEKRGDPDCPPSLVIIVDEFAALVNEVPEFVDGVVDVAQRGRSLGLHLILATQRPAGVIKDNLRANTNLRIALRMADVEDSNDILGDSMAAHFDPTIPGRGAAKTGPGRIRGFQTGYAGGRTTGEPPAPRIDVAELAFGSATVWEAPAVVRSEQAESGPSDIARIVDTVVDAAAAAAVVAPRKPWLDELATSYDFSRLPNPRNDERLPLGVLDDPAVQAQPAVYYEPDRDGNLAILGASGSGKSTVLRTIAVGAALTGRNGGPTHVYGLDFGSRGLTMLAELPHVGAIVSGDDEERVIRTIRMLRDIVDERATRYAAVNAGSIAEYRRVAGVPDEARILLLVDGIGAFKDQYEFGPANLSSWYTAFAQVAADGRSVGVHVVVAGDRPNSVPNSIAATVQRRVVLRMAQEDDYLALGVPKDVLSAASPPGRGILDGNEVQIAVLGGSGNVAVQAREIARLGTSVLRLGGVTAPAIASLGDRYALSTLPAGDSVRPVIGVDDMTLAPTGLSTTGSLLLAGPPGSGRTTAVETIATAFLRAAPSIRRFHFSPRRSPLSARHAWTESAVEAASAATLAARLLAQIDEDPQQRLAIFIEALPEFTGTEAEYELERLIRSASRDDHFVLGEGEISTWQGAYTLAGPMKAGRRGLLLTPGDMDGDTLLGTNLGRIRRADFPAGRGFLVSNGRAQKLQVAVVEDGR